MPDRTEADINQLLLLLQQLDQLLEAAVTAAQSAYGTDAANSPYRGNRRAGFG